jgi:hypothetical protein
MTLWQITAPHFCAALITSADVCTEAAPILGWAVGKRRDELRDFFARKGWAVVRAGR